MKRATGWIPALVCSALVAVGPQGAASFEQAAPPRAPQQPTFGASTELVTIDVTVLGRDGEQVKDLAASDFTVAVDGQPRRIASLQFIDESSRALPTGSVLPAVSSNAGGGGGRLVLIVADESTIRFGNLRPAVESLDRLLAGFGPADRIGLAALPGPRVLVEFGRDRQRIIEAAKKITGAAEPFVTSLSRYRVGVTEAFEMDRGDSRVAEAVVQRECAAAVGPDRQACQVEVGMIAADMVRQARNQTARFMSGLRALLLGLRSIEVPKIVVLFSEGLLAPDAATELVPLAYDAAAARAVIHTMRLDRGLFDASVRNPGGMSFDDMSLGRASLETLAGGSRGNAFDITAGGKGPFERLAREVSGYYLLGIEPEGNDRDGKPHRIQVKTARPGVTVRARSGFTFTRPRPATTDPAKLLAETLQSPAVATSVALRVTTANMADDDGGKVRVMVLAEIDRGQEKGGAAHVGYAIYDDKGKVAAEIAARVDLEKTSSGALAFSSVSAVPAGSYTVKIAAVRDGRAGSVEHQFTARLTPASPFRLGDLLIRSSLGGSRSFNPSLEAVVSGDAMLAFVQGRLEPELPPGGALALDIVKDETGPALLTVPMTVNSSKTKVRTAQAAVDARLLPPGDYGARLAVTIAGKTTGTVFTRFSLQRSAGRRAAKGPRPPTTEARTVRAPDVLTPEALGPFLDELVEGATPTAAAALQTARQGKFDEAVQQLKTGAPTDPRPAFLRGLALYAKGRIQEASDAFREAMRADPEFLLGAFYIGACYAAGGRDEQAINAWETSLVSLDRFPLVYRLLSDALMRRGEGEGAAALLDEALARWPDDEVLRRRMVGAAFDAGRYDRVWQDVDRLAASGRVELELLFLAMRGAVESAIEGGSIPLDDLLARVRRYRDLYVSANGPRQALVAEWVAFIERKAAQ